MTVNRIIYVGRQVKHHGINEVIDPILAALNCYYLIKLSNVRA